MLLQVHRSCLISSRIVWWPQTTASTATVSTWPTCPTATLSTTTKRRTRMCWTRQTSLQGERCSSLSGLSPAAMLMPTLHWSLHILCEPKFRQFQSDLAEVPCPAWSCPALPFWILIYLLLSSRLGCTCGFCHAAGCVISYGLSVC